MNKPICANCGASLQGAAEGELLCVVDEQWRMLCPRCAEAERVTPLSKGSGNPVLRSDFAWGDEEAASGLSVEGRPQARFRFFDISNFDQELCETSVLFHTFFGSYPDMMVASSGVHEEIDHWANLRRGNFLVGEAEEQGNEFFPVAQLLTRVAALTFAVDDSLGEGDYVLLNMKNDPEAERTGAGVCTNCGTPLEFGEDGSLTSAVDSRGRLYCNSCRHARLIESLDSSFDEPLHRDETTYPRDYDINVAFRRGERAEARASFVDLQQFDKELDQLSLGFLHAFMAAPEIMVAGSELYDRIDEIARTRPENLELEAPAGQQESLFPEEPSLATIETTVSELSLAVDESIEFPRYILVRDEEGS